MPRANPGLVWHANTLVDRRIRMDKLTKNAGAVLLASILIAACGDDSGPTSVATPGPILVSLTTPHTDDGAALLLVTGPGFASAGAASASHTVHWKITAPNELRAIVLRGLSSGPILRVDVPDVRKVADYEATLVEVADRLDDQLRADLAGYSLSVASAAN